MVSVTVRYYLLFYLFFLPIIIHSRVIRACPVTTDCIVAMRECENNSNNSNNNNNREQV